MPFTFGASAAASVCCAGCTERSWQLISCFVRPMAADFDFYEIAGTTAFVLLLGGFVGLRSWYYRRLASRIFADADQDGDALQDIQATLEELNKESRTHTFSAERVGRISLRNHPVTVVYGWITAHTVDGSDNHKCVFAVVHRDEAERLRRRSDVFNLVFTGSLWSVFWVKLSSEMRLTG